MKKITSVIIAVAMLCAIMVTMIPSVSAAWDGSSVSASLIGTGTELDPYLISSENDLAFVAKQVNDAVTGFEGEYFKLTADLDLGNNSWTPIGATSNYFRGIFDGDGHTIYGLNVYTDPDNKSAQYGGLFGRVDNGVVKNITVEGAKVVSFKYAGAIVANLTAKVDGAPASVINCHAVNCDVRGVQVGAIVGRTGTTGAPKGHMSIIGCSADSITLGHLKAEDFPNLSVSVSDHFVGGIIGGAGSTIISGCFVTNMTADVHGTGFAPVGGIVGVFGASKGASDINNCGVVGVTITASAESHPEKTSLGGLVGKMAHVAVSFGDPNTEYNVFNCFVANVKITNNTTSVNNGMVAGLVNDTIYFNDVYYVAQTDLQSYGYDAYFSDYPFMSVNSLGEIRLDKLNKGNSTAVWVLNPVAGYPTIDFDAAIANQPAFVDYYVELEGNTEQTTAEPEQTTEKPEETTKAPEPETTPAPETTVAPENETTAAVTPEQTKAPATTDKAEEKGCGGMIAGGVMIVALLGTAIVFKKK